MKTKTQVDVEYKNSKEKKEANLVYILTSHQESFYFPNCAPLKATVIGVRENDSITRQISQNKHINVACFFSDFKMRTTTRKMELK